MNETPRSLGYLPDPHKRPGEKLDFDAQDVLGALQPIGLPVSHSNRAYVKGVLDQRNLGSCVANTILQAVRASHCKQGMNHPKLGSRLFTYFCARLYHGDTKNDTGTYLRTAFASLNKFGFCPEEAWTYEDLSTKFRRIPSTSAFHAAIDQKSPTIYRRIYEEGEARLAAVKQALAAGFLVAFGTDVSIDFANGNVGEAPVMPPIGQAIAGGHAMCMVGYESNDVIDTVNSWGTGWGLGGYWHMAPEYLMWAGTRDLWIVEHAPKYSDTP